MSEPIQNLPSPLDEGSTPAIAFDYSTLAPEVADRLRSHADTISGFKRRTVEMMGEMGRVLVEARGDLEPGAFLLWIEQALGMTKSVAYRCIKAHEVFGAELPKLGSLPVGLVQEMAEDAIPKERREDWVRRGGAGEALDIEAIRAEVSEAKKAGRDRRAAEREANRRAKLTDEQRSEEDALRVRGEKGREARERKEQREREARQVQNRQREARITEAAKVLVDMVTAERAATFFDRFRDVAAEVYREAEDEAHRRRARAVEPTDLPVSQIYRVGPLYGWISSEDQPRIEALAAEIERDGLKEPPIVVRTTSDARHPYHVVEGIDAVRAVADVLHRPTISVRVAPPAHDIPLTAPVGSKPSRPIIGIRTGIQAKASSDHFGELRGLRRSAAFRNPA